MPSKWVTSFGYMFIKFPALLVSDECTVDEKYELVGNGYCNDETNTIDCNYDGGDCCANVITDHCSECTCHYRKVKEK